DSARVRRDYGDASDRNRLLLDVAGAEVGPLPPEVAEVLALEIDTGLSVDVEVAGVSIGENSVSITVLLSDAGLSEAEPAVAS
ncbi:MAG TPA: hypothetical protein PKB03_00710, partial [Baekduia sp.]|nr:hypothetical protein [Baekduia sp.]